MKYSFFLIAMCIVSTLLSLFNITGLVPHIIVSILGLVGLIVFTVKTRKEWKIPALEVIMRLMYLIAIITGGILMKIHDVAALGLVHRICACIFCILLVVLYLPRSIKKK